MSLEEQMITVKEISSDVLLCIGPNGLSNSLILVGERVAFVADTQLTPSLGRQVKAVAAAAGLPIRYVLNTHGDSDHLFGNQEFWPDSLLMCHRLTRERLLQEGDHPKEAAIRQRPLLRPELEQLRIVVPELAFNGTVELDLGNLVVQCLSVGPAHTPGDVAVWVPERKVLFTSDLVFAAIFPVLRNANPEGWIQSLDRLGRLDAEMVIPGHGDAGDKRLLTVQKELLVDLLETVQLVKERGLTLDDALQEVRFPRYEEWPKAADRIPEAIRRIYAMPLQSRQS